MNDALANLFTRIEKRFYSNRVTFEMAIEENVDGRIKRTWQPVPHPHCEHEYLVDIPCLLGPDAGASGQTERHLVTHTASHDRYKLALAQNFGNLAKTFRAIVDGREFNITGLASDNTTGMLIFLEESSA